METQTTQGSFDGQETLGQKEVHYSWYPYRRTCRKCTSSVEQSERFSPTRGTVPPIIVEPVGSVFPGSSTPVSRKRLGKIKVLLYPYHRTCRKCISSVDQPESIWPKRGTVHCTPIGKPVGSVFPQLSTQKKFWPKRGTVPPIIERAASVFPPLNSQKGFGQNRYCIPIVKPVGSVLARLSTPVSRKRVGQKEVLYPIGQRVASVFPQLSNQNVLVKKRYCTLHSYRRTCRKRSASVEQSETFSPQRGTAVSLSQNVYEEQVHFHSPKLVGVVRGERKRNLGGFAALFPHPSVKRNIEIMYTSK